MRLSEAIRLGSLMGPQLYECLVDANGGSCAMGAAMKAASVNINATGLDTLWPELSGRGSVFLRCPACDMQHDEDLIWDTIVHLNDEHRWTREQIADWVASHERTESTESVAAVDPVGGVVTA